MDESGFIINSKRNYTYTKIETKKVYSKQSMDRRSVTVIGCGNAEGEAMPSGFIFPDKKINKTILKNIGGPEDSLYGFSPNFFMNYILFNCFIDYFIKHTNLLQKIQYYLF